MSDTEATDDLSPAVREVIRQAREAIQMDPSYLIDMLRIASRKSSGSSD